MDWYWLYFNYEGRLNRLPHYLYNLLVAAPGFALSIITVETGFGSGPDLVFRIIMQLAQWILFLMSVMVSVKRLHDLGYSGKWLLCPILFSFVFNWLPFPVNEGLTLAIGASIMIFYSFLLLWRGTVGPNRFGPDPLAQRVSPE